VRIQRVALTVARLDEAALFYREVLRLPVTVRPGQVSVEIGASTLVLEQGEPFSGAHHLAFGIAPAALEPAHAWLSRSVELLVADGSDVIVGPDGWDSRSLYFSGPEGIVLELIARDADAGAPTQDGGVPRLLSVSEVGIGVPDVAGAVRALTTQLALPVFPPQEPQFAPVGSHDGLLVLVDQTRIWFPTDGVLPATGPVAVTLRAPRAGQLSLRPSATVLAAGGPAPRPAG